MKSHYKLKFHEKSAMNYLWVLLHPGLGIARVLLYKIQCRKYTGPAFICYVLEEDSPLNAMLGCFVFTLGSF